MSLPYIQPSLKPYISGYCKYQSPDSHSGNRGSNPLGGTKHQKPQRALKGSLGLLFCHSAFSGLAAEDPLRHLSRQNPEPHRRCKRRALTQEECSRLLQAAYDSDCDRDGASPGTRALLYIMVFVSTGVIKHKHVFENKLQACNKNT